ncbi:MULTISPECIES: phage tail family protein [Enterococcus]|uniref:phage tail family protein n=1 Tax=Enterococcus TaxID=1350 RepID=UPI0011581E28|nr:phage tail family protein [Enterococcus faecium]NRE73652.1 phage tail family protein [Enterococcus faecium]HAR0011914.1 phage tail family protein [Enterococcus faecium]
MNGYLIDFRFIKNQEIVSLKETLGIECISFARKAPQLNVEYQEFSGSNGSREVEKSFKSFTIEVEFYAEFKNMYDYQLKETELYAFLFDDEGYYIFTDREPGKKYFVRPNSVEVNEVGLRYATYKATFTVFRGCSESMASTLSDFSLSNEWQFSQGLVAEDYKYTHRTSNFIIYNAGDFAIDPREHALKITLEGESEGNVTIFNKTTGERFVYYPEFSTLLGQTLTLERVYPKLNGVNCGIDTNLGLITLAVGTNEIEIQNVTRVESKWDFNFLYK